MSLICGLLPGRRQVWVWENKDFLPRGSGRLPGETERREVEVMWHHDTEACPTLASAEEVPEFTPIYHLLPDIWTRFPGQEVS